MSVFRGRYSAQIDGPFVVLLLGMRVNRFWRFRQWVPVFRAMNQMLRTLDSDPATGFLGAQVGMIGKGPVLVQYWRSFAHLDEFAKSPSHPHRPAWQHYNKVLARAGSAGIWHEAYEMQAGAYECIYTNCRAWVWERRQRTFQSTRSATLPRGGSGLAIPMCQPWTPPGRTRPEASTLSFLGVQSRLRALDSLV